MKGRMRRSVLGVVIAAGYLAVAGAAFGTIGPGLAAPALFLKDTAGKSYDLSASNRRPMTILYFFDADSRPSLEGLLTLNQVAKGFKGRRPDGLGDHHVRQGEGVRLCAEGRGDVPRPDRRGRKGERCVQCAPGSSSVCVVGPGGKVLDSFPGWREGDGGDARAGRRALPAAEGDGAGESDRRGGP